MSEDTWIEYKSIYGNTLFIYNKATGEHKWPYEDEGSTLQDHITHGQPIKAKEFCSVATQTDDYGCDNGCSSVYINTSNVIGNGETLNNINPVGSVDVEDKTANSSNEINQQGLLTVSDSDNVSDETIVEKTIECSQRSQQFEEERDLTQHKQIQCVEETIECTYCKKVFNYKDEFDSHLQFHFPVDKRYKCPHCNKKCASNSALKIHIRQHTGEKPFECSVCNKKFRQKGHLSDHLKIHTGIKPHVCIYCEKGFGRRNVLKKHMVTHMNMNAVSNSNTLNEHENHQPVSANVDENMASCSTENAENQQGSPPVKSHKRDAVSVEKFLVMPFECTQCNQQFYLEQDLNRHERLHNAKKIFECTHCKKIFHHKGHLNSHLRVHNVDKPYKCPHCDKQYVSNNTLKIHIRRHTGEKPFECSVCSKTFTQRGHLSDHLKIHTGIKPHECFYCKRGFARRSVLRKHMATHIG